MALQHFQHSCRPSLCSFHGTVLFFHALFVFLCFYCCVVEQAIVMDSCFSVVVVHCHRLFIFFVFRFCFPFHSVRAHVKSDVFNDCDIESHEFIIFVFILSLPLLLVSTAGEQLNVCHCWSNSSSNTQKPILS